MESTTSFNSCVTEWLSRLASGRREALSQGARRFTSLIAQAGELEIVRAGAPGLAPALLRITSGLHRGASMELTNPEYLVGSADECDIVLRGAQVVARHCTLSREWSGITVRDLRGGEAQLVTPRKVSYDGGAIEAEYDIGGVHFTVRHPPTERQRRTHKRESSLLLGLVVAAGVISVGALTASSAARKWRVQAAVQRLEVLNRAPHPKVVATPELVDEARRALADDQVTVRPADGRLLVEGKTSQTALRGRIRALADDLRGTIAVEDHVVYVLDDDNSPGPFPVRVQGVMVGKPSYFITDSGVRYFVGGVLPDGAEVVSIDSASIQFRRAGTVVAYKLQ
jgi:Inner membrane component of T3SS, cytoplasmic domain